MQRHSDGTVVIAARRFEVPSRYRHLTAIEVRYASWDLTQVHLVDTQTGQVLCRLYPQDKTENATGLRRSLEPISVEPPIKPTAPGIAPLLAQLMQQQAATGLPPAYLPTDDLPPDDGETS
jgi:hypothetical protein